MITLEIEITEEHFEDSEQLQEQFQRMIQERNQFQNELYDFLVNPLTNSVLCSYIRCSKLLVTPTYKVPYFLLERRYT